MIPGLTLQICLTIQLRPSYIAAYLERAHTSTGRRVGVSEVCARCCRRSDGQGNEGRPAAGKGGAETASANPLPAARFHLHISLKSDIFDVFGGEEMSVGKAGHVFVVSTPIGNLEDITERAKRILAEVDLIAAEDTRRTGRLLSHLGVRTSLTSFHDFNKERKTPQLVDAVRRGRDVAVVSDAGTPGISDPAYALVTRAIEAGLEVIPIPGPSAFLSALVVSGLPTDRFVFEGFLPRRASKRRTRLRALAHEPRTLIFYESLHRLRDMLEDVYKMQGDRRIYLSRELTKKFEETRRGRVSELLHSLEEITLKGEFVVVVEGWRADEEDRGHPRMESTTEFTS